MPAEWTKLPAGQREECASASCGHSPASWRMDAGGTGSYFCGLCYTKITGIGACANCGYPEGMHPVSPELQCPQFAAKNPNG